MQNRYAWWVVLCLAIGLWLYGPSCRAGFISDDFLAAAMLDGVFASPRHPLDLFSFADGTAADVRQLQRYGSVPWWASSHLRLAFLRPLSSALISLDRALFGDELWAYHIHSLCWWMLLVITVALLYRRVLPISIAGPSCLLYALDEGHHYSVLWLANRGGLFALTFCTLAFHQYLRFRQDGVASARWWCLVCLCLALSAGEWAFPMLTYFLAYEVWGAREGWPHRARALLIPVVPALIFLVLRTALGYGVRDSGVYVDPVDVARFTGVLVQRVPLFLGDLVWGIPAQWWDLGTPWRDTFLMSGLFRPDVWRRLPDWRQWQWALGACAILVAALGLRFAMRRCDAGERAVLRWMVPGSLLALLPVCASFPSTRLTLVTALAFVPCVVWVARGLWRVVGDARARTLHRVGSGCAMLWLVSTQLLTPASADFGAKADHFLAVAAWMDDAELPESGLESQRVLLLTSTEFCSTFFLAYARHVQGHPMPRSFHPISAARHAHRLRRLSDSELELSVVGGSLLESDAERLFRSERDPLRVGDVVELDGLRVHVEELQEGRPKVLRLELDAAPEDGPYVLLATTEQGLRRIEPPELGESVLLPRAVNPSWAGVARGRHMRAVGPVPDFVAYDPVPDFVEYEPPR